MNQRVKLIGGQSVDLLFICIMYVFKKNFNVLIIALIVISFNLIAHSLWSNYFCTTGSVKLPNTIETIKTGNISPILTGSTVITKPKLSTKPKAIEITTGGENKDTVKEGTKPVLVGGVSAGYDGETVFERVKNRLIFIGVDIETSEFITWKCFDTAVNPKHCVKSVVGVATSESSLFKRCKNNNCMGLKPYGELKGYDTLNLALDDWINRYNKYRYKNNSGKDWIIRSHYCKGDCSELSDGWSNWTRSFDSAVNKLGI